MNDHAKTEYERLEKFLSVTIILCFFSFMLCVVLMPKDITKIIVCGLIAFFGVFTLTIGRKIDKFKYFLNFDIEELEKFKRDVFEKEIDDLLK